jgi:asparagine synthetase B (glutamine-hydrolysing)
VRAAERGFNNILTGEVAEFVIDMRHHLVDHLLLRGRIGPLLSYTRDLHERGYTWKGIYRQVLGALAPRPALAIYLRYRSPRDPYRPSWLLAQDPTERPQYGSYFIAPRDRWRVGQLAGFNGPGLSMEADHIAQMKAGVRTRRPWADVDLWELFLSLPAEQKFADAESKGLTRRLLRGRVPDAILDRTDKTTFNDYVMSSVDYPELSRWLRHPSRPVRGVDYAKLGERLEARDFTLGDYIWARDLAAVHAFQAIWD